MTRPELETLKQIAAVIDDRPGLAQLGLARLIRSAETEHEAEDTANDWRELSEQTINTLERAA